MREKDIVKGAMEEAGFTMSMVAESLGYAHPANVFSMVKRSKTMTVGSFVRILGCMGFKVVVVGRGKEWEVDATEVQHGKYKRKEKTEKTEPKKFFEKEKEPPYKMINGRKVVEVSKGVWKWVEQ